MATQITPRGLVHSALNRRVIRNNPIIPAPVNQNVPASSLYDFGDVGGIVDPRSRMKLPPQEELGPGPIAPPPQQQTPPQIETLGGTAPVPVQGQYDSTVIDPRDPYNTPIEPIQPSSTPTIPKGSSLEEEISQLLEKRNAIVTDPDQIEDDDSKLMNFFKGSQFAIRQSMRTGDLGFVVGAAIGGGLRGLFTKKEDDIRDAEEKVAKIDKEIERKTKQYGSVLENRKKQADAAKSEVGLRTDLRKLVGEPYWDVVMKKKEITDADAKVLEALGYGKLPVTSWQDIKEQWSDGRLLQRPEFGGQYADSGIRDSSKVPIQTTSPLTGQPVSLTPGQLFSGEATIAAGNASREQQAQTTNVNNAFEAAKTNAKLMNDWYLGNIKLRTEALTASANNLTNAGELHGIASQLNGIASRMQNYQAILETAADPKERENAQKDLDKAQSDFEKLQKDFDTTMGKTQAGAAIADSLQKQAQQSLPRPTLVRPGTVQAVTVGGKIMSRQRLQLIANGEYGGDLKKAEAAVKANGWTIR